MKIVVISTLDTKGIEAAFMRDQILKAGHTPLIIDPGSAGTPAFEGNVTRQQVAIASGESLADLLKRDDKAYCQRKMTEGLIKTVLQLYEAGVVQGVIAVGGGQGTAIATAAMQVLPIGIPKVMVSTVACGKTPFGPYVGVKDVTMIHSVADVSGLNRVTKPIIAQATAAVIAMAAVKLDDAFTRESVALTMTGVVTPGAMVVLEDLEKQGFEVIVFHGNGIGTKAMEELVLQGRIKGVVDYSPHDVIDGLYDGLMPAPPERMRAEGKMGIPYVVVPGCADIRLHEWREDWPADLKDRPYVRHTPTHTHFRTIREEMAAVGHYITQRLNEGNGPRAALIPLRGFSMMNREGKPLYDTDANLGYTETLRAELSPAVRREELDLHINDPEFAHFTARVFMELWSEYKKKTGL
jgi:uncharacterized protein (UPF0261 family)